MEEARSETEIMLSCTHEDESEAEKILRALKEGGYRVFSDQDRRSRCKELHRSYDSTAKLRRR